jgi:hypothetical protein
MSLFSLIIRVILESWTFECLDYPVLFDLKFFAFIRFFVFRFVFGDYLVYIKGLKGLRSKFGHLRVVLGLLLVEYHKLLFDNWSVVRPEQMGLRRSSTIGSHCL